jgi:hypothetical protein
LPTSDLVIARQDLGDVQDDLKSSGSGSFFSKLIDSAGQSIAQAVGKKAGSEIASQAASQILAPATPTASA